MAVALQHLGLVFDCTCPDRNQWRAAWDLVNAPLALHNRSDDAPPPRDFNLAIRQGLARALAAAPEAHQCRTHLVSFADCPEEDLPNIEDIDRIPGVYTPREPYHDLQAHPLSSLAAPLNTCYYCSGLDVWDHLELALQAVAAPLLLRPAAGSAVLIVGNSPPHLPTDGDSPLRSLLMFQDAASSVRRRNALFTQALEALRHHRVPVVYLFLSNHITNDSDSFPALQKYQRLQRLVADALSHYLPIIEETADADGIARGVAQCWPLLTSPPS